MPRKKKEPKPEQKMKVIIDPAREAWLHNSEEGKRTLLEASAFLYQTDLPQ
ncbi:MAG TPA: hypothetical protein VKP04_02405 [Ktedonobacteraceae bacterium]|nr:hypothetical protein [Ktedonobacteraceae bacterium]